VHGRTAAQQMAQANQVQEGKCGVMLTSSRVDDQSV
jgi:hypothetical protein